MDAYEYLAASYDALTYDIPYEQMLRFMQAVWQKFGLTPKTVVDLACGTGSLSVLLAREGYQVFGVDLSEPMLTQAAAKAAAMTENPPYFIRQNMTKLRLPQSVDCVVCLLDSVNYLTDPADCQAMIKRVSNCLKPGGMFLFDINTEHKLKSLDGQVFLDETEDVYCVWRTEFDEAENLCYYGIDLFERAGGLWRRSFEQHTEYAYSTAQLRRWLEDAGFRDIMIWADCALQAPEKDAQRVYFSAIKE